VEDGGVRLLVRKLGNRGRGRRSLKAKLVEWRLEE
jgi:hypothetical protein